MTEVMSTRRMNWKMARNLQQIVFLYLCGFLWTCRGNPSASCLRDLTASATGSCCSPQPFIELSFFIRLNSAGSCNSPDYLSKGVRLEIKPSGFKDWQPIRFYSPTRLTNESTVGNVTTVINDTHVAVDDEGFSSEFRLYTNDSQSPIHVREYICGQRYANNVRFRWVQQYLGIAEKDEDTWSIDNITIRYWDGSCYTFLFEEDFENSTAVNLSFVIQRGVIAEPPCGPTASGQALYFNRRAASSGARFERRRGNTPRINFASTSGECNLPRPLPRTNQECSVESDRCATDVGFPVCSLGSFECRCEEGYQRDGVSCVDINECASQDTHNCSQICSNNNGGFECQCGRGYELAEDGITCNDINECASEETHICSQVCNNTDGSFVCQCRPGYELADNGVSCNQHSATIGFEQTVYVVMESTGNVTLNVSVLAGGLSRAVNVTLTVSDGSVPFDYIDPGELVLQFGATNTSYSVLIPIVDDGILENNETFLVELISDTPEVTLNPFSSEVVIVDDSNVAVGLEQTNYSVVEGENVEVCVVLVKGALERNVFITLSSKGDIATAPGDYLGRPVELLLSPAAQMSCINISTVDDTVIEPTETFIVTLASAEPSVAIFPQPGIVEILDNDNVIVGLEHLSYVVGEDGQELTICAILSGQNEREVNVSVSTEDGSAIAPDDYSTLQNVLTFISGVAMSCTNGIRIMDDSSLEDTEFFNVVLSTADSDVSLDPASATVTIEDNDARALEEQISNGAISSNEAATILMDLLISALERGEPVSSNFSEAFVRSAGSVLDSSNIQESSLTVSESTAVASSVLDTLDTFALAFDGELQLETENISLEVMEVKADDEQEILGIRREGSEIVLPAEVIRNTGASQVRVGSFYFRNLSGVLPNSKPNSDATRLVSPVISSTLGCSPEPCRPINTTTEPIMVVLTHQTYQVDAEEPLCVFWDFNRDGGDLTGNWSTEGCSVNKSVSSTTATVCKCNHLTHFAILLSPKAVISGKDAYALQIIGYVGVSISLVCLLMTVVAFLFLRSLRGSMRNYIHVNLCISLMVAQLTFIVGVDKTTNEKACQAVAVLLHYFFLVSFMWMLMEGLVLYVALVRVFVKHQKRYMAAFTIFSYGAPALYMGVVVPLGFALDNGPHYGGDACWLRHDTHFIWAFIAPVMVTILINIGFFIMAIRIMYHHEKKKLRKSQIGTAKHWLKSCISLVLVMGITWIIGVLSFHEALLAVSYIFTIFVAFQGVVIFILFVPLSKQVREQYKRWWKCKVAGSEFLSSYFGEMAEHSLSRQFTRLTSFRSSTIRGPRLSRSSDSRSVKNPSEFVSRHNETSICEKEKVPLETMESAVPSEKVEELEGKKDLQVFAELLEDAAAPTPTREYSIPAEGWSVIWKAPSEERSQEPPAEEGDTQCEEECTGL